MGETILQHYGMSFIVNEFGVVTGSATATQFPDKPCLRARLKAMSTNGTLFKIGGSQTTVIWELAAAAETDWFPCTNLNQFWYQDASGTMDKILYWLQR